MKDRRRSSAGSVFGMAVMFWGLCLLFSMLFVLYTWPQANIREIVFHMKAPLQGANVSFYKKYVLWCILPSALLTGIWQFVRVKFLKLLAAAGVMAVRSEEDVEHTNFGEHAESAECRKNAEYAEKIEYEKHLECIGNEEYRKKEGKVYIIYNIWLYGTLLAVFLMALGCFVYGWNRLQVSDYLKNQKMYSGFIDKNYVDPSSVEITFPEKKRNLIYIYLESMENTFADVKSGGAFAENLIPNLTRLSLENENFSGSSAVLNGAAVTDYTTWTMGAMFAQSTGLPLILPIDGNAMYSQDTFFPELTGIGDILKEAGYKNLLLMGSHAMFGGREIFYQDHGAYRMLDYDYSIVYEEIPKDYYVFWGYEDDKLFTFAKKHLLKAAKSEEPFNLTMLTVDTHYEDGYICEDCELLHEGNPYADVYACSDRKVGAFIQWIQKQDFYENTTIVLVGDHLTMDKDFCKSVAADYERKVYVSIINGIEERNYAMEHSKDADAKHELLISDAGDRAAVEETDNTYRLYTTMDMFPTTLAALGVKIEGERLGLGTNLYSGYPTLLELYGKDELNKQLGQKSALMERLAESVDESRLDENWSALSPDKE